MTPKKYGILSSSIDPTQLSLTVESFSKVLIGLAGWYAVSKGMDATTAQTQLQAIIDLAVQAIPLAFTLWNTLLTIWGLVRKLYVALVASKPTDITPIVPTTL